MSDSNEFFSKVSTRSERDRAFTTAIEKKTEFYCKSENDKYLYFLPLHLKDGDLILESNRGPQLDREQMCTVSFSLVTERYFMKSLLSPNNLDLKQVILRLQADLYKLQRRDLYRLPFPTGYGAEARIQVPGNQPSEHKFNLVDLSGGGFGIEIDQGAGCPFQKDQMIVAKIVVGKRIDRKVSARVAYVRTVSSESTQVYRLGFQFVDLLGSERDEIVQLVWDIHRDLYSHLRGERK